MSDAASSYVDDLRKQLADMPAEPELVTLVLAIPSKRYLESGAIDLSSWPQLAQAYAAFSTGTSSTAEKMTSTFLRAVADLIDRIQNERRQRQGPGQHAQPEDVCGSPGSTEEVADMLDLMSVSDTPVGHHNRPQKAEKKPDHSPDIPAAGVSSGPGDPSTVLEKNPFKARTTPQTSYLHDPYYTPSRTGAAYQPSSQRHGSSASLGSAPTRHPMAPQPSHHPVSSSHTPGLFGPVDPGPRPSIRPSQVAHSERRESLFGDSRPPGPQTGWMGPTGRATGSRAEGNAFPRSHQPPASSFVPGISGGLRSSGSGTVQGGTRTHRAASVGSQGGWSTGAGSSASIKGRRRMGGRSTAGPAGDNRHSNVGNDAMDCDGP